MKIQVLLSIDKQVKENERAVKPTGIIPTSDELAFSHLVELTKKYPPFRSVLLTTLKLAFLEYGEKHSHIYDEEELNHFIHDFWHHLSGIPNPKDEVPRLIIVKS